MSGFVWNGLRRARYALPGQIGRLVPETDAQGVCAIARRYAWRACAATFGYFHADDESPDAVLAANLALLEALGESTPGSRLSIKAPALGFDPGRVRAIAERAGALGIGLTFDSHGPAAAERTFALVEGLLADFPGTGCVLPARWRRSREDARRLRDSTARIRLVKGEWADSEGDLADPRAAYLALVEELAGRSAQVGIASHDVELVEQALARLAPDTPCELEQLRNLPQHRTVALARGHEIAVRIYIPFGPGWWPYAIDKVFARPELVPALLAARFARAG